MSDRSVVEKERVDSALVVAAYFGDTARVTELVTVVQPSPRHLDALFHAANRGHTECLRILLNAGFLPPTPAIALDIANTCRQQGHHEISELLTTHGCRKLP